MRFSDLEAAKELNIKPGVLEDIRAAMKSAGLLGHGERMSDRQLAFAKELIEFRQKVKIRRWNDAIGAFLEAKKDANFKKLNVNILETIEENYLETWLELTEIRDPTWHASRERILKSFGKDYEKVFEAMCLAITFFKNNAFDEIADFLTRQFAAAEQLFALRLMLELDS